MNETNNANEYIFLQRQKKQLKRAFVPGTSGEELISDYSSQNGSLVTRPGKRTEIVVL